MTEHRQFVGNDDGEPTVFAVDEQIDQPVELARWTRLAVEVLQAEGVRGNAEMNLHFVEADAIAALNDEFLGHTGPTDVLAFPLDMSQGPEPGRQPDGSDSGPGRVLEDIPLLVGDVVICPAVAAANAAANACSYDDELAVLVVHGILHLVGHDHDLDEEAEVMFNRQRQLIEEFHRR